MMRWLAGSTFLLLMAGLSPPLHADTYRCEGSDGQVVYTGRTDGYAHCRAIDVDPVPEVNTSHPGVLRGSVYLVQRADGTIEYTNRRPENGDARAVKRLFNYIDTCVGCRVHSRINWHTVPLHLHDFAAAVRHAADRHDVSPALLRAVIHAESAFDPLAMSSKGAQGLMQLMPGTASDMGVDDPFNARQNIQGGARYLAMLLKRFDGDITLAAAAYNAGPGAVSRYHGVPPYAETRVYVKRVKVLYQRYRDALGQASATASTQTPSVRHGS